MISPKELVCVAIFLAASDTLSAAELYNLDFQPPEVGAYLTVFGMPTIQSSAGPFSDALVFHAVATYDEISLPIGVAPPVYNIGFDLLTHGLENSPYAYTILLDTPEVRTICFHGLFNAIDMINLGRVSPFSDDQVYHCEIVADFPANRLSLTINNGESFTTTVDASRLDSIRFSMGPWRFGAADDPGTYVALDNVIVSAVPEPSLGSLSLTAVLIIAVTVCKRRTKLKRTAASRCCCKRRASWPPSLSVRPLRAS